MTKSLFHNLFDENNTAHAITNKSRPQAGYLFSAERCCLMYEPGAAPKCGTTNSDDGAIQFDAYFPDSK